MKPRILCLCLALALMLCSCGADNTTKKATVFTTTAASFTTTDCVDGFATTTTGEASTANTTSNSTSVKGTHSQNTTTVGTSSSTTTGSTTASTASTASTNSTDSITTSTITTTAPFNSGIFKATIRENVNNRPVSGVYVSVWISLDVCVGSAFTDENGVALINVPKQSSYRIKLGWIPQGYEADEEYRFSTNTVNITIRKTAVQNELDHSQAQYDVGKMMTDFSLTDTEGEIYRLSNLLKEKKLVVLDFWYATCEPCKLEFPIFEAATQKYGEDIILLAVDPIDPAHTISNLRNQLNANPDTTVTFPMLRDTCSLYLGFDVTSYPTTVFIDPNGFILDIHVGAFPTQEAFFATIERYLQ